MNTTIEPDFQAFDDAIPEIVGTPYKIAGDTLAGMDCSGLVKFVYGKLGVDLKNAPFNGNEYRHKEVLDQFRSALESGDWIQINEPTHGCLVAMSHAKMVRHCGVWLNGGRVLHATNSKGAHIMQERDLRISHAFRYTFYRWHGFSQ